MPLRSFNLRPASNKSWPFSRPYRNIMDVIFTTHKGKHLGTVQKYHIYQKTKKKTYRLMIEIPLLKNLT